jgi:mono/diheme cytochrome c family protein
VCAAAAAVLALALSALATPVRGATGNAAAGKLLFRAACGQCHTLKAAGTKATSVVAGPVLDGRRETVRRVMNELSGVRGSMPPFIGILTQKQIANVVAFVVAATDPVTQRCRRTDKRLVCRRQGR